MIRLAHYTRAFSGSAQFVRSSVGDKSASSLLEERKLVRSLHTPGSHKRFQMSATTTATVAFSENRSV